MQTTHSMPAYPASGGQTHVDRRAERQPSRISEGSFIDSMRDHVGVFGGLEHEGTDVPAHPKLAWVESQRMRWAGGLVIALNMLALILETDAPDHSYWVAVNIAFWVLLAVDVGLRLSYRGWQSCSRLAVVFDVVLVILGFIDLVATSTVERGRAGDSVTTASHIGHHHKSGEEPLQVATARRLAGVLQESSVVRGLQMTRLLRIFRIFRMIKKLEAFTWTLLQMLKSFAWIFLGMVVIWFILAIILTRLLGHGLLLPHDLDEEVALQVQTQFQDIVSSMYALFQLTTLDDWARIAIPVIEVNPVWQWIVIAYVILMSWTMLSLLTAVASESLITASSTKKSEEIIKEDMQREGFMGVILKHFAQVDEDGNNQLDKNEFKNFMEKEDVRQELKAKGMNLESVDIVKMWDTFDVDGNGWLSVEELVQGFVTLQEQLATKHVANLGYAMKKFNLSIEKALDHCSLITDSVQEKQDELIARVRCNDLVRKDIAVPGSKPPES